MNPRKGRPFPLLQGGVARCPLRDQKHQRPTAREEVNPTNILNKISRDLYPVELASVFNSVLCLQRGVVRQLHVQHADIEENSRLLVMNTEPSCNTKMEVRRRNETRIKQGRLTIFLVLEHFIPIEFDPHLHIRMRMSGNDINDKSDLPRSQRWESDAQWKARKRSTYRRS